MNSEKLKKSNARLIFCFKDAFEDGGMPNDIRKFLEGNLISQTFKISLITNAGIESIPEGLKKIEIVSVYNLKDIIHLDYTRFDKNCNFILVGYSSIFNLFLGINLIVRKLTYSVIPSWQIHTFLDLDNPFEKKGVPSIENLTNNNYRNSKPILKRVNNGKPNLFSYLNFIKRFLYRKTLGKILLNNALKIFVFSKHEKRNILDLIKINKTRFGFIHFGTEVEKLNYGKDKFQNHDVFNIVYWGRVDFYYKGIDTMLLAISIAKKKGINQNFKLWLIGPNFNNGYFKAIKMIKELEIDSYVEILKPGKYTPGTIGFLKHADFSIIAPKWDGFSRTLRESICLGVPVITNRETHFDRIIEKYGNGLIFENEQDLACVFQNLNSDNMKKIRVNAEMNKDRCRKYFSWIEAAKKFQKELIE